MCQRPDRERKFEIEDDFAEDPIWLMPEPPGALGDIVRRMKRRAALERGVWASTGAKDVGHNTA